MLFRDGPSGRRAVLIGGPDVGEVVRVVQSARAPSPTSTPRRSSGSPSRRWGCRPGKVRVALGYWAAYPDEIEQQIRDADDAQRVTEERWQRERRLLS